MIQFLLAVSFISLFVPHIITKVDASNHILASYSIHLNNRHVNKFVNNVFSDNILLTLYYLSEEKVEATPLWKNVKSKTHISFVLNPQESFAFHDDVVDEYTKNLVKTTNSHFIGSEGFRSSGWLYGDGVCHLASLMYKVAYDAGLETYVPRNHSFAKIPEIDATYGVSIYSDPQNKKNDKMQNLYIRNNTKSSLTFEFEIHDNLLHHYIVEKK